MSLGPEEYVDREVGWVVTVDHDNTNGRVGWGQLLVHAHETEASFERVIGKTVFMDKSLTEHMIPDGHRVRWRSFTDDMDPVYNGVVRAEWLFDSSEAEDLAYNVDRFNAADAGAARVYYSVDDMIKCAQGLEMPTWEEFAKNHPGQQELTPNERWVMIYG